MRWLTIAVYTGAGLLLFVVSLYLTLPYQSISRWLLRQAETASGMRIHTLSVERIHPLGLRWQGVSVVDPADGRQWVALSSVTVRPVLASLFGRRNVVNIESALDNGTVEGQLVVAAVDDGRRYRIDVTEMAGVNVARLQPFIPQVKGLGGQLSGKLSYEWSALQPLYGTGTASLLVDDLNLQGGMVMGYPVGEIKFTRVACGLSTQEGQTSFSACSADGPAGTVTVKGTAQLQSPLQRTLLSLRAEVALQGITSITGQPITAVISGPLGHPEIRIEGGLTLGRREQPESGDRVTALTPSGVS